MFWVNDVARSSYRPLKLIEAKATLVRPGFTYEIRLQLHLSSQYIFEKVYYVNNYYLTYY